MLPSPERDNNADSTRANADAGSCCWADGGGGADVMADNIMAAIDLTCLAQHRELSIGAVLKFSAGRNTNVPAAQKNEAVSNQRWRMSC